MRKLTSFSVGWVWGNQAIPGAAGSDHSGGQQHLPHLQHLKHLPHLQHLQHLKHLQHLIHLQHLKHLQHLIHLQHLQHLQHLKHLKILQHWNIFWTQHLICHILFTLSFHLAITNNLHPGKLVQSQWRRGQDEGFRIELPIFFFFTHLHCRPCLALSTCRGCWKRGWVEL